MAISQTKYVDITSRQEQNADESNLNGRVYTSSEKIPAGKTISFDSLDMISTVFDIESDEYKFANKYFSYRNLKSKRPKSLSFSNYNPNGRKCTLKAEALPVSLATLKAIEDGSIKIDMGGVATEITSIDLTEATSYSDVASVLQTKIREVEANGELWTQATVTYDSKCGFVLQGGKIENSNIGYATNATTGTSLADKIKWTADDLPFVSAGMASESPIECINRTMSELPDLGSFTFLDSLTTSEIASIAQWNHNQNVRYIFSVSVNATNYASIREAVSQFDGTCLTYGNDKFVSYMPMAIFSATDFEAVNGTVCYMFNQFAGETASVTTDTLSNELDSLRINYYGQTRKAGQPLNFYQRGYVQGSIADMGVYANEIWLKKQIENTSLNLFTRRGKLPANSTGVSILRSALQTIFDTAIKNGTFLIGKSLSRSQQNSILEISNDSGAVSTIQDQGYWLDIQVTDSTVNSVTEYYLQYTLLYAKGDAIRKIEGTDILI